MSEFILNGKLDIEPLLSMKNLLQKILTNQKKDEIEEMAAVQVFEVCFELAWKVCQKVLNHQGKEARFPREVLRLAAEAELIKDPEIWFEFMDKRNITSHTYDINVLDEIFSLLPEFVEEFNDLINNLQKLK